MKRFDVWYTKVEAPPLSPNERNAALIRFTLVRKNSKLRSRDSEFGGAPNRNGAKKAIDGYTNPAADVRFTPGSERTPDIAGGPVRAVNRRENSFDTGR
jgi:hypothetical protein